MGTFGDGGGGGGGGVDVVDWGTKVGVWGGG